MWNALAFSDRARLLQRASVVREAKGFSKRGRSTRDAAPCAARRRIKKTWPADRERTRRSDGGVSRPRTRSRPGRPVGR